MPYRPSPPLRAWRGPRRALLDALAASGAAAGVAGTSQPLVDAYVVRVVAELQGFARALHGFGIARLVALAAPSSAHSAELERASVAARRLDVGNPALRALAENFARLGIDDLDRLLARRIATWRDDRKTLARLLALRNALAHGDDDALVALAREGVVATLAWTSLALDVLDRLAGALDYVLWDRLHRTFGREPW